MEEKNLSLFLGAQCRKIRKMQGLSQEELGEKIGTTGQTISNYEKYGINKVDIEDQIAKALGVNLREEMADKEGTIGEVGKEILFVLIEKGGCCEVGYLEKNEMYGMSKERVNHEISKIAELDMCQRDKYLDLYGRERDDLFITAKGIITYKNLITDDFHEGKLREYLPNVRSYEQRLVPFGKNEMSLPVARDMEEYVELRKWIPLIYKIIIGCTYKADYIAHLYLKWANSFPHVTSGLILTDEAIKNFFPGVSAYHDIIYRMAYGYTDEWRKRNLFETRFNKFNEIPEEFIEYFDPDYGIDTVRDEALMEFLDEFPVFQEAYDPLVDEEERYDSEFKDYMMFLNKMATDKKTRLDIFMDNVPVDRRKDFPDEWFTREEIERFIKDNYAKPETEWEREIQSKIEEVEKLIPRCKEEYYKFSKEWEENGLADLVRELCC